MLFWILFRNNYKYGIAASSLAIPEATKFIFVCGPC